MSCFPLFPGQPRCSSTWAAEGRQEDILAKIDWKETGEEKAVNNKGARNFWES